MPTQENLTVIDFWRQWSDSFVFCQKCAMEASGWTHMVHSGCRVDRPWLYVFMQYRTLREPSLISFLLAARVQNYVLDCVGWRKCNRYSGCCVSSTAHHRLYQMGNNTAFGTCLIAQIVLTPKHQYWQIVSALFWNDQQNICFKVQ